MKKLLCFLFDHDWAFSHTLTAIMAQAPVKVPVYKCLRCGDAEFR